MKVAIRYACHACGEGSESAGDAVWVRCPGCGTVLGFDWLALHTSQAHQQWLMDEARRAAAEGNQHSDEYVQCLTRADEAAAAGDMDACRAHLARASELAVRSFPYLYPPEIATDAAYRQRHVARGAWVLQQQRMDPALAEVTHTLADLAGRLRVEDPMPVLMRMAEVVERQARRVDELAAAPDAGAPEDPDGRPAAARLRMMLVFALGGYLPFLSPEHRVTVLERIHGKDQVSADMDPGEVELPSYLDWQCPACPMLSMQPRAATVALCPACGYRLPLRTGASAELVEGVPGVRVTDENRMELVVAGLGRTANVFGRMIGPRRLARLVRGSLPRGADAGDAAVPDQALGQVYEQVLADVLAFSRRDGGDDVAAALIEQTRALLRSPR